MNDNSHLQIKSRDESQPLNNNDSKQTTKLEDIVAIQRLINTIQLHENSVICH